MSVRIDLPTDELIDCWTLVREIASAVVPDLNPRATGIECVVAKQPASLGVIGIGDLPYVEQDLTDDDRAYLLRVLPSLPELRIPYSDDVAEAFLHAYRARPDRLSWEPVLLTESRYLYEYNELIGLRWQTAGDHLVVLQQWLDTGRIKAFRRKHVPTAELLIGTLIPRSDVEKYLDYCEMSHSGEAPVESMSSDTEVPETESCIEKWASTDARVLRSGSSSRSVDNKTQSDEISLEPVELPDAQPVAVPQGPLLDIRGVSARTGISVSTLHERMRKDSDYYDPDFPPKISFGERTVRYSQLAVDAWIQGRLSAAKK